MSAPRDLEECRERLAASDEERDLAGALRAAERSVPVTPYSGFFLPLPPVAQDIYSAYGEICEPDDRAHTLHLDARGRPVAHLSGNRPRHLWYWDDDSFVEMARDGIGPHVRRYRREHVVTASWADEVELQRLTWRDGRAVRADIARHSSHGVWAAARVAEYDRERLVRIWRGTQEREPGDLDGGLARAAAIEPAALWWDGRVEAPEPWPGAAIAEPLGAALDEAVRAAIADAGVELPFAVEVFTRRDDVRKAFPPLVRVVSRAWRDRIRRSSKHDGAALSDLREAVAAGMGAQLDLTDRLDDEALRACRALNTAFHASAIWTRPPESDATADAVGERVAELLHARPVAGAADPFIALVEVGGPYTDHVALERARRTAPHFERFLASVASTRGKTPRAPSRTRALQDRDALEAHLAAGGLDLHAHRIAQEAAELGFRLDPGHGRSRLGGCALLPPGELRPVGREGRELTFLAGIDLSELPGSRLPATGWLLFYADLGDDEAPGLIDPDGNGPGSLARAYFSEEPAEAEPRAGDLRERHVAARPFLTLPSGWGAREALGLDVFDGRVYEEIEGALSELARTYAGAWVGGHATGAQGLHDDEGTFLLLQMADDPELGFEYLDAGTIQFRIPGPALAARDWTQVVAIPESS
jgi:hypothetical protein